MITGVTVCNFKSLSDFKIDNIPPFSCLVGLNGSGKTSVLQLFDFLGHLAQGQIESRGWNLSELITYGARTKGFQFSVDLLIEGRSLQWSGTYHVEKNRVENEIVRSLEDHEPLLKIDTNNKLSMRKDSNEVVKQDFRVLNYPGSLLPYLNLDDSFHWIRAVRTELANLKSFELLSPASLRRPSQESSDLGIGGDGLPGFLSQLSNQQSEDLLTVLKDFYPKLQSIDIKRRRFGWKNLLVREYQRTVQAGHVNDGLLRILAVLSQRYSDKTFLFFDEIENGINQEIIQKLVSLLLNFAGKQIMVTTHSALVLNYLSDPIAKDGVFLLYQDEKGFTHARKFFEIEEIREKLEFLGPGQVMNQTDLVDLATRLCTTNGNISRVEA